MKVQIQPGHPKIIQQATITRNRLCLSMPICILEPPVVWNLYRLHIRWRVETSLEPNPFSLFSNYQASRSQAIKVTGYNDQNLYKMMLMTLRQVWSEVMLMSCNLSTFPGWFGTFKRHFEVQGFQAKCKSVMGSQILDCTQSNRLVVELKWVPTWFQGKVSIQEVKLV